VNRITRVWERLFLGSIADAETLAKANPYRITAVLTLCPQAPRIRATGVEYFHFAIADDRPIPAGLLDTILLALSTNIRSGRVLVHCAAGSSRSPIIVAAWMHSVGYRDIEECLSELWQLRPIIDPSPILLKSVKENLA
jgi:atypical dual specificity phosphatase